MSGDTANEELLASVRKTGNRFLEKPFTLPELRKALGDDLEPPGGHASNGNGHEEPEAPAPARPPSGVRSEAR